MKKQNNQPRLRLAADRGVLLDGFAHNKSSMEIPVASEIARKLSADGSKRPLIQSETVGCDTPKRRPKSAWDSLDSERYRRKRSIKSPNIGISYPLSIDQTYAEGGQDPLMQKPEQSETFVQRAMRVARIRFNDPDYTQGDLGKLIGVSQPSVSDWKHGPKIEHGMKLAKKLGANLQYLYLGEGEMFSTRITDSQLSELLGYWPDLDPAQRGELLGIAGEKVRAKHKENRAFRRSAPP